VPSVPPLLVEQKRLETTISRVRWGAVALALVLGPLFPNLSGVAVIALGVAVAVYNVVALRASARAASLAAHRRIAEITFGADLVAVCAAMFLFSVDPYWTTFFIGTLVIIGGAFRFGSAGAYTSMVVLSFAYAAISAFRASAFGIPIEPQRAAFHLSVFALTALLIDRVIRDAHQMRGEREGLIAALERQISENERLFAEASEARALRELDRLKDEFLAAVSHDLRTPLTVIAGSLELMERRGELSDDQRRLVDQAERHVRRLQRNVEDLLTLAQLQEAKIALERQFLEPAALLAEIAVTHDPVVSAKRQRIAVACEPSLPPVLVDRRRIAQAVGNLVENASRYAPEGTAIELRAERDGEGVRFAVADQGPGVPAAERERVFDKFFRGERTKGTSGTGLGLAIARTLVELHGGRIHVEERAGGGARFVVSVPHERVPAEAAAR
jgi:signal transduction histidine kinase